MGTLLIGLALIAANATAAQAFAISGRVTAQGSGQGVPNTEVFVTESGTSNQVALPTTTASDGSYSVLVPAGTYDITFTPPAGSEFESFVDRSEVLTGNRTVDVVLVPAGSVSFSGVLQGEGGAPLANAQVRVGNETMTTTSKGAFSGTFAPGTYELSITGNRQSGVSHAAAPSYFYFYAGSVTLTNSVNETLTLPVHALTVRTVGPGASAIPGVKFQEYVGGSLGAHGTLAPGVSVSAATIYEEETTDANGNATLSLPYYEGNEARLEAAPPAETQLARTPINVAKISEDQTREVKLSEGVSFSGVLQGEGGAPLANAQVRVGNETMTTTSKGAFSGTFAPGT
ncbi:MAG TPA: carboxypeptidase-like regulatory domain-containing protein, partial [Solirubrobacteraceae bacterium]|nr:carboxypeptidase-like regulatory domain-containing protein [Solirubrobacteraceae bacterium]